TQQLEDYARFLKTISDSYIQHCTSSLLALGFDLSLKDGFLFYRHDFQPPKLCYDICFIRHGQTEGNREPRVFQGKIDLPENQLTMLGVKQADECATKLEKMISEGWNVNLIIVSPLKRARDTAEPFIKRHSEIAIIIADGAAELGFGEWENQMLVELPIFSFAHLMYMGSNALAKAEKPYSSHSFYIDGENFIEALLRVNQLLMDINKHPEIITANKPKVVIYSHGMLGSALLTLLGNAKQHPDGYICIGVGSDKIPHGVPMMMEAKISGKEDRID
ncbi:hypothetical protein IE077_002163, partial [Cardiosporidium cionae]